MEQNSLSKNTILLSVGALLTNVLQFLMVPVFSRWLSTKEYGTFDLCVTYVTLALPFINLATGEALFRFALESGQEAQKKYISSGMVLVAVNFSVVLIVLAALAVITGKMILLPFCLLLFGQLINSYSQSFLRGIKKLNIYACGSVVTALFTALFVFLFVFRMDMGVHGIILGYALGYVSGDVVLLVASKYWRYFSVRSVSLNTMKQMIKYSYPLIPNNISWWVLNASDRIIISSFLSLSSNGIFAIAHKIPGVCSNVFGMFNISWQQSATEALKSNNIRSYYNGVYNSMLQILLTLCAGILSLDFLVYQYVFDIKYAEAALYAPILIASVVFNSISQFYGGIMISLKRPKDNGRTTILSAIINIVVHIVLIRFVGLYAAAVSTLAANFVLSIIRRLILRREVNCKMNGTTFIACIVFVYMFILAYMQINVWIRIVNVLIAAVGFCVINKAMLRQMVKKCLKCGNARTA